MLQRVEVEQETLKMFVIQFSIGWAAACGRTGRCRGSESSQSHSLEMERGGSKGGVR